MLSRRFVVTIRFAENATFKAVAEKVRTDDSIRSGAGVFTAVMEALVDRGADVLEHLGASADDLSRTVFKGGLAHGKRPARSSRKMREA